MGKDVTTRSVFMGLNELLGTPENQLEGTSTSNQLIPVEDGPKTGIRIAEPRIEPEEGTSGPDDHALVDDFNFARRVMHEMIKQGQQVVEEATKEAAISAHPRSIEAAQQAIKTVADAAKQLLELHDSVKKPEPEKNSGVVIQDSNVVVTQGTTLDMLRKARDQGQIQTQAFEVQVEHDEPES